MKFAPAVRSHTENLESRGGWPGNKQQAGVAALPAETLRRRRAVTRQSPSQLLQHLAHIELEVPGSGICFVVGLGPPGGRRPALAATAAQRLARCGREGWVASNRGEQQQKSVTDSFEWERAGTALAAALM